ncbi:acyl-CoA thioesterase [Robertmurraya kyonggiensis]|uniref:acyl-CoA thioesterase n=1 Tax=Robertmurraya kyonggiensis TaxID=1037680 RepID=UPI00130E1361|nr:thioesterase family protein [Robertmurraya kyonggiensis]
MITTFELRVKEEDIDRLGHVNYNKYISYSEEALGDWYKKTENDWREMAERSFGTVVVNLNVSYIKEARLGEILNIVTTPLQLGTKSFVFKQEIYNEQEEKITEITKKFVMFDLSTRKGITVLDSIAMHFR